jgi:hypothetical protein
VCQRPLMSCLWQRLTVKPRYNGVFDHDCAVVGSWLKLWQVALIRQIWLHESYLACTECCLWLRVEVEVRSPNTRKMTTRESCGGAHGPPNIHKVLPTGDWYPSMTYQYV